MFSRRLRPFIATVTPTTTVVLPFFSSSSLFSSASSSQKRFYSAATENNHMFSDDLRDGGDFGGNDMLGGGFNSGASGDDGDFELTGRNSYGANPADYASSGIHGPAATVARRELNPETQGKHRQEFHSEKLGRCVLCDESIGSWMGHVVFVSHQARLSIVERVMSGACGPPRHVVDRWWQLLNVEPEGTLLHRIRSLSSDVNSEKRRERLVYLLRFLQANGILKVALGVYDDETKSFGRSNVFERFEMVGDNVVKVVFYDRLQSLFPLSDGGAAGKMSQIQQLIDSNEGLLQAFDYLELDKIIGTSLSQSKFKSDVMEALFGELQTYLWAVTHHWNTPVEYPAINAAAGPELRYVEAVVRHTLLELTDCILMFAVESSVTRSAALIQREYKGSNMKKPIPLSRSEIEMRKFKRQQQQLNKKKQQEEDSLLASSSADPFSFLLLDSGRYAMRPYLTSELQPIPSDILNDSSSSSFSSSSSSSSSTSTTFSSATGAHEFGLNVIKPLAQRIAEEEERRRLKEASWKISAPYFFAGNEPSDDAEMAFEDFQKRMVDASSSSSCDQFAQTDEQKAQQDVNETKNFQKKVQVRHLDEFGESSKQLLFLSSRDIFAVTCMPPLSLSSEKSNQMMQQSQGGQQIFVVCPCFEPLTMEKTTK